MTEKKQGLEALRKKVEEQLLMIGKLKGEEEKLGVYVDEFKQALKRKSQKEEENNQKSSKAEEEKLGRQLQKEVESAQTMLKNYQHQLRNLQRKNNKLKFTPQDLLEIEERISMKEMELRECQSEIKDLGIVKRKQEKLIEKKEKIEDGVKLAKLVEEVRKQRDLLENLKQKNIAKEDQLNKRRKEIAELEQTYHKRCQETGETPHTYEDFKQRRKLRHREEESQSMSKSKGSHQVARKMMSVKEMIRHQLESQSIEPTEKNLKELQVKKEVAENSLKLAHKKDEKELSELKGRLETLKEENASLEQKLVEKKKEKELTMGMAGERSANSQARRHHVEISSVSKKRKNSTSKTQNSGIKLDPINPGRKG